MKTINHEMKLFGLDLSGLGRFLTLGFNQLLHDDRSWLVQRSRPPLLVFSGDEWMEINGSLLRKGPSVEGDLMENRDAGFFVTCVRGEQVLFKLIDLPESAEAFIKNAVQMELERSSPFEQADLVSGWRLVSREQGVLHVLIAMTSEKAAERAIAEWQSNNHLVALSINPGLGAIYDGDCVVEFSQYVDPRRWRAYQENLRSGAISLLAGFVLMLALLALPAISSAFRASQLSEQLEIIQQTSGHVEEVISSLHLQRDRLVQIREEVRVRPNYSFWLNNLANSAPDGTFFERLSIEGLRVEVAGYSENAATYLRKLTESNQYSGVAARSAFVADRRTGLERFTIDWELVQGEE